MAKQILSNARVWVDQFDMSGDYNAVALAQQIEAKDVTPVGNTQRVMLPGLRAFNASLQGLWEGGALKNDEILSARIGATTPPLVTIDPTPNGGAEGDAVWFGSFLVADYQPHGAVGDVFAFSVGLQASGAVGNGLLMHNATRTAGGTGTIQQLSAVPSGRSLLAGCHLLAISGGGALTVTVQSAALIGFGSPTTRATLSAMSAIGAQTATVAGPITDTFYRITWTLTGSTPSAQFVVALGLA